jgi:hypothetical protein
MSGEDPTRSQARWSIATWVGVIALPLAVTFGAVVALASGDRGSAGADHRGASAGDQPLDLAAVPGSIAVDYRAAAAHAETYQQVPCFCGCEDFLGHRQLLDCFVRADGGGWDAHAAGCWVCLAESVTVRQLLDRAVDADTIRTLVVSQFGSTAPTAPPST